MATMITTIEYSVSFREWDQDSWMTTVESRPITKSHALECIAEAIGRGDRMSSDACFGFESSDTYTVRAIRSDEDGECDVIYRFTRIWQ
ncbi:hypothetical protein [Nocardia sp. NPDC049707]|uniref:hypothetical protein n=1 Tax=Nocardia sp. NPDC049707 TaxID=3154735 RepID=UPI003419DBE8